MMTNTYLPHVGGVARSVSSFADEYQRQGHRVLVVAPVFPGKKLSRRAESIVERVAALQNFNGSDFSVRLPIAAALSARLDAFPADIIHAHHPFLLGDTALRVAASKNVPVIFTHHTRYEDYAHYVYDSPALRQFAIQLSTDFANLCDGVIAPSESIAELIRSRGVEAPVRVVPSGIDINSFANGNRDRFRRKYRLGDETFVLGHVGRLAPEKNLAFLAEAAALFVRERPDSVFAVVGSGPDEAVLSETFALHGVSDRLLLLGKQTGAALYAAYRGMDAFAFASKSETQGLVLAEAMAAGLPVVALDAPGVREVVRDGTNGYLLPEDASPADLAAHAQKLARAPSRRERFAQQAIKTAEEFSLENCARAALEFYGDIQKATRRERLITGQNPWGTLLERLSVEWNLLAEKAHAVAGAVAAASEARAS